MWDLLCLASKEIAFKKEFFFIGKVRAFKKEFFI
jgi:hypothetical protein